MFVMKGGIADWMVLDKTYINPEIAVEQKFEGEFFSSCVPYNDTCFQILGAQGHGID